MLCSSLCQRAGLEDLRALDRSYLIPEWTRSVKKRLGMGGWIRLVRDVVRMWGIGGLTRILESQRIFESDYTG